MRYWREPVRPKFSVTQDAEVEAYPLHESYREHETDAVLAGHQYGAWFYPTHRLYRHFIDGKLHEQHKGPLEQGEDKPQKTAVITSRTKTAQPE